MAINFGELLTTEQKRSLLSNRILQFAAEGYQHELNRATAEATGNTAAVEAADKAITDISAAIEQHQAELASLPAEAPAE